MKVLISALLSFAGSVLFAQTTELTFVFLNNKSDSEKISKEQSDKLMEGHMANINRLASEGKLRAAGPFDGGGGMFVFNSNSIEQVREWINTDPAVRANRWNVEILPYSPIIGSVCKVGEQYEMVRYSFVRFTWGKEKLKPKKGWQVWRQHIDFWKGQPTSNPIITLATFADDAGDVLVQPTTMDESILKKDPAIELGLMNYEKKILWVAKGSFCEK